MRRTVRCTVSTPGWIGTTMSVMLRVGRGTEILGTVMVMCRSSMVIGAGMLRHVFEPIGYLTQDGPLTFAAVVIEALKASACRLGRVMQQSFTERFQDRTTMVVRPIHWRVFLRAWQRAV